MIGLGLDRSICRSGWGAGDHSALGHGAQGAVVPCLPFCPPSTDPWRRHGSVSRLATHLQPRGFKMQSGLTSIAFVSWPSLGPMYLHECIGSGVDATHTRSSQSRGGHSASYDDCLFTRTILQVGEIRCKVCPGDPRLTGDLWHRQGTIRGMSRLVRLGHGHPSYDGVVQWHRREHIEVSRCGGSRHWWKQCDKRSA